MQKESKKGWWEKSKRLRKKISILLLIDYVSFVFSFLTKIAARPTLGERLEYIEMIQKRKNKRNEMSLISQVSLQELHGSKGQDNVSHVCAICRIESEILT